MLIDQFNNINCTHLFQLPFWRRKTDSRLQLSKIDLHRRLNFENMCRLKIDIGHVWNTGTQNKGMEKMQKWNRAKSRKLHDLKTHE